MSHSGTKSGSDIEEGEIHTDDEKTCVQDARKHTNLEDLSSCEEVFSSDSVSPKAYGKGKRYFKVRTRGSSKSTKPNEDETLKIEEKAMGDDGKRRCLRKRLPPSATGKTDTNLDDKKSRRRHQPKRRRSPSFSPEAVRSLRPEQKSSRHGTRRLRSEIAGKDAAHHYNAVGKSRVVKPAQKKKNNSSVLYSCPEKAVPKTSLKKRLMNMMTFSSNPSTNGLEEPVTVPKVFKVSEMIKTTKELDKSEPEMQEMATEVKNKRKVTKAHSGLDQGPTPKKVKISNNVEQKVVVKEESGQNVEVSTSIDQELVSTEQNLINVGSAALSGVSGCVANGGIASKVSVAENIVLKVEIVDSVDSVANESVANKSVAIKSSVTIDDDLAALRKLALESSALATGNKRVTQNVPAAAREDLDDLTELRLQALRSAVIKKHNARKAKAAAMSSANKGSAVTVSYPPPPNPPQAALEAVLEAAPEKLLAQAQITNANVDQCADSYDKTTTIVDMDLGNTTDEDSPPTSDGLMLFTNHKQVCEASMSPYYVPEQWTPISEGLFIESSNGEHIPYENNYLANSGFENPILSTVQQLDDSFIASIGNAHQQTNFEAIVNPALYHPKMSAFQERVEPIAPKATPTKYSVRPNLVKLPIALKPSKQLTLPPSNLDSDSINSDTDLSLSTPYGKSQNNTQVSSSLIHVELTGDAKNLNNKDKIIDKNIAKSAINADINKIEGRPSEDGMKQKPSPCSSSSDIENMDIASMIVVDEIVCSSPEPVILPPSAPQTASNVLRDVPVPSIRYASRSVVQNVTPPGKVHLTKPPIKMQKLSPSIQNPFTLNNLKRETFSVGGKSNATAAKQILTNTTIAISSHSRSDVTKPNKMPLITKNLKVNVPKKNKESPGRFVINLGEDSESDEDGQIYYQLPSRTIVNELALQPEDYLQPASKVPAINDQNVSARVDAFLKDTRAKHDRRAALIKQKITEQTLRTVTFKSPTIKSSPDKHASDNFHREMTVNVGTNVGTFTTAYTTPPCNRTVIMHKKMETTIPLVPSMSARAAKTPTKEVKIISQDAEKRTCVIKTIKTKLSSSHNVKIPLNLLEKTKAMAPTVQMPLKQEKEEGIFKSLKMVRKAAVLRLLETRSLIGTGDSSKEVDNDNISNPKSVVDHSSNELDNSLVCEMAAEGKTPPLSKSAQAYKTIQASKMQTASSTSTTALKPNRLVAPPKCSPVNVESNATASKPALKTVQRPKLQVASSAIASTSKPNTLVAPPKFSSVNVESSASASKPAMKSAQGPKLQVASSAIASTSKLNRLAAPSKFSPVNIESSASASKPAMKSAQGSKAPLASVVISNSSKQKILAATVPKPSTASIETNFVGSKNVKNVEKTAGAAVTATSDVYRTPTPKINALSLEKAESKLLRERTSLLLDLTVILDHLNDSSKVEHTINEMQETIAQQEKIIDLAKRSIKLTHQRIACETKKRAHTFKLIHEKRKSVSCKRDLCSKLREDCVTIGEKLKGESYRAPQPLEAELRLRLEDVAAGVLKTIKNVNPPKRDEICFPNVNDCPSDGASSSVARTLAFNTCEASTSAAGKPPALNANWAQLDMISVESNEGDPQQILITNCPYEINGICGDVSGCPFKHVKHR